MTKKKPDEEQQHVRKQQFQRQLQCALTIEEWNRRANESARLIERRDQFEAELKSAQKSGKAQLSEMDAELRRINTQIRDRAELRLVQCERVLDYDAGLVSEVRTDTGEVMGSPRKMTDEETQRGFEFGDGDLDEEFS